MAKAVTLKIKLVSSAGTGFYYVTKKNSRTMTEKMSKNKYDPIARNLPRSLRLSEKADRHGRDRKGNQGRRTKSHSHGLCMATKPTSRRPRHN